MPIPKVRLWAGGRSVSRPSLTRRQLEVLSLIADGLTVEQIADRLFLSPHTVTTHLRNAAYALDAQTRAQAVAIACKRGLLDK